MKGLSRGFFACVAVLWAGCLQAATFNVTSTDDLVDAAPGNGVCATAGGTPVCTLRAAVMEANATAGPHVIELPSGNYLLSIDAEGNDDASAGDLDVVTALTIRGGGTAESFIDGNSLMRVFDVQSGSLELEDLTIRNGRAVTGTEPDGGGIVAGSNLSLLRVHMIGNRANIGAAVRAVATNVEIRDSLFSGNVSENLGFTNALGNAVSGIESTIIILSSSFVDNGPPAPHGYVNNNIHLESGGSLTLVNSTVADNTGAGVRVQNADLYIGQSTITGNYGNQLSTFSFSGTDTMEIAGSILQRSPWGFAVCQGDDFVTLGYNISEDGSCAFAGGGDLEDTDAQLGPLQANGGWTPTRLPQAGSPAIDRVPVSDCLDEDGSTLTVDQRGLPRPGGGSGNCDSGSVETGNQQIFSDRFES